MRNKPVGYEVTMGSDGKIVNLLLARVFFACMDFEPFNVGKGKNLFEGGNDRRFNFLLHKTLYYPL